VSQIRDNFSNTVTVSGPIEVETDSPAEKLPAKEPYLCAGVPELVYDFGPCAARTKIPAHYFYLNGQAFVVRVMRQFLLGKARP